MIRSLLSLTASLCIAFPASGASAQEFPPEWPSRSHPAGLLQAKRCAGAIQSSVLESRSGALVQLEELPPCLRPAFLALAAAVTDDASESPARAVVRVRLARQFYEASAYYQPVGREIVYLPAEIDHVIDAIQREWPDYSAPDGELGWSGFVLLVAGDEVSVRVMGDEPRPADVWLHSGAILGEFFPDLPVRPVLH